ncbi:MAG: deoxyribose-phosphate aldolase [Defluviitaleaceae bacterium]|nr:deoxyribose-phosphate aldolase [Defluviitaleaceae bacterium]
MSKIELSNQQILSYVDHTLLKPFASWHDIIVICDEALEHKVASVCVPPTYISRIHNKYGSYLPVCTVVGFPLGYSTTGAKLAEVRQAVADGAIEMDMVINISDVKNSDFSKITGEISALKKACVQENHKSILKVIIETCYLTEYEKIQLCGCVTDGGADFIKTSTGFGTDGATMEDVLLFKQHIGKDIKIKAAGGIKTREDMVAFIEAGCARLGTSSAIKILNSEQTEGY